MAKRHKRIKCLKSEKAKVKLKSKTNRLPKNLNVTDTSFKAKKIVIREQLKHHDETEILSTRKLNVKDLLMRLHHHNGTARTEALRELKEMLLHHSPETLHSELGSLLRGIAALSLDKEKNIRKDSLCALCLIFEHISKEKLMPYLEVLTSYLNCAMTHINPWIKEDSLYFLDILVLHCGNMLMKDSHKILSNFLDMICKLHSDKKKSRQLTIITSCESTNMKWRIQVLKRLVNMFNCILVDEKLDNAMCSSRTSQEVKHYIRYLPIYSNDSIKTYEIDFNKDADTVIKTERTSFTEEFIKYMDTLVPLMFDIWFEVCPDEKLENYTETTISSDASVLLKSVVEIIQLIIDYIETLNQDDYNYKRPFIDQFYKSYMKNFMSKFPYGTAKGFSDKSRKCQEDYVEVEFNSNNCLEQNLGLCRIHAWFTSLISHNRKFHQTTKSHCISVIQYLNDTIKNWCASEKFALSQLTKLLRTLFLSASLAWHENDIDLSQTLELIIKVSFHVPKDELQSDLFSIIGNIMLECNLNELYREKTFKKYVAILPDLLLRPSISEATIHMICQVALRFKQWIRETLTKKRKAIIENAEKINIINSHDDKRSRLMIYNLFYLLDAEIYY